MELTKQDKKHIEARVQKLSFRMALAVIREVSCVVSQPMLMNTNHAMTGVITPEKPILSQRDVK